MLPTITNNISPQLQPLRVPTSHIALSHIPQFPRLSLITPLPNYSLPSHQGMLAYAPQVQSFPYPFLYHPFPASYFSPQVLLAS